MIFLALPVASAVKHAQVDRTGLGGFTLFEDYAQDVLTSAASAGDTDAGGRVVLLVSSTDTVGDLLRYVKKYRFPGGATSQIVIADLNDAKGYDKTFVSKHAYLNATLVGDGNAPVSLERLDPARTANLSDTEAALRYAELGGAKAHTGRPAVCMTSDIDRYNPESEQINYRYEMVPRGLVYMLSPRGVYRNDPAEHLAKGRELWDRLRVAKLKRRPLSEQPAAAVMVVRRVSKLCNDFGVYCHKHAGEKEAVEFYERALHFDDLNLAPLKNLQMVRGEEDRELDQRIGRATTPFNDQVKAYVTRALGPAAKEQEREARRTFAAAFNLLYSYGLVRDGKVVSDLRRYNPDRRSRTYEYWFACSSLRILVDPEGDKLYAERGALYFLMLRQGSSLRQRVQALKDLETARPYVEGDQLAALEYQIAEIQLALGNLAAAEEAFKQVIALNPEVTTSQERLATPQERLADIYAQTGRVDEAIQIVAGRMTEKPLTSEAELMRLYGRLRNYYAAKQDPEGFVAFANEYMQTHPDQAYNTKLFLFDLALGRQDYERAEEIVKELAADFENPTAVRVRLLALYAVQDRYADIVAMEELPLDLEVRPNDRIQWHDIRGQALLQAGQPAQALTELQKAYDFAQAIGQESGASVPPRSLLNLTGRLWVAALLVAQETHDPETEQRALATAERYRVLTRVADTTEADKVVADAYVGWTRFKIRGDIDLAIELIEPAVFGVPNLAYPKLYLGAVLIEKGEVERGVALVKKSLEGDLSPIDRAEAVRVLKAQGIEVEEPPAEPEEAGGETTLPEDTTPEDTGADTEPDTTPPDNDTETGTEPDTPPDE